MYREEYKQFIELVNTERAKIKSANNSYNWCNGINAVDFFIRMEKVPVVYNSGKPNEKTGTTRKITKMMFGKKAYDLLDNNGNEIVTKEAIDKFEFDDFSCEHLGTAHTDDVSLSRSQYSFMKNSLTATLRPRPVCSQR